MTSVVDIHVQHTIKIQTESLSTEFQIRQQTQSIASPSHLSCCVVHQLVYNESQRSSTSLTVRGCYNTVPTSHTHSPHNETKYTWCNQWYCQTIQISSIPHNHTNLSVPYGGCPTLPYPPFQTNTRSIAYQQPFELGVLPSIFPLPCVTSLPLLSHNIQHICNCQFLQESTLGYKTPFYT